MNAPWPIDIWPLIPISTVSPATAMTVAATCASWYWRNESSLLLSASSTRPARIAIPRCLASVIWLHLPCGCRGEQSRGPEHQHEYQDREAGEFGQVAADVSSHVIEQDAENEPADDRSDRAVQPADDRGSESQHEDRVHAVGIQERLWRDEHPG